MPGRSVKAEQAAIGVGVKALADDERFLVGGQCRRGEKRLEVFVPCLLGFPDFFPRIRINAVEHAKNGSHVLTAAVPKTRAPFSTQRRAKTAPTRHRRCSPYRHHARCFTGVFLIVDHLERQAVQSVCTAARPSPPRRAFAACAGVERRWQSQTTLPRPPESVQPEPTACV